MVVGNHKVQQTTALWCYTCAHKMGGEPKVLILMRFKVGCYSKQIKPETILGQNLNINSANFDCL